MGCPPFSDIASGNAGAVEEEREWELGSERADKVKSGLANGWVGDEGCSTITGDWRVEGIVVAEDNRHFERPADVVR